MNVKQALAISFACDVKTCPQITQKAPTCTNMGCYLNRSKGAQ